MSVNPHHFAAFAAFAWDHHIAWGGWLTAVAPSTCERRRAWGQLNITLPTMRTGLCYLVLAHAPLAAIAAAINASFLLDDVQPTDNTADPKLNIDPVVQAGSLSDLER
jgi:hypothetical protein